MKKIQKFYGGGGIALGLDLAPYSYAAPAASTTASTAASTAAGSTVLPTLATVGKIAWPIALVGGATYGGLYLLGHAKNGAVSGAIEAAAEKERRRHLAEAEAKWREKNQYYADLINTYGSIQYPVGTFYDYDPSTGTAHLERNLGNDLVGRWTQNMRTHEQSNPYIYDITTGAIYNGEMTGPHSAYVPVPRSLTPITLSTGQTVALPSDITDYRVFNEASGEGSDNSGATGGGTSTPVVPPPMPPDDEEPKKKRYRDRRREGSNRSEPEGNWDEFLRGFDRQGMPSPMSNPSFVQQWTNWPRLFYGLGNFTRFLGSPGGIIIGGGVGTGLYYLHNALKNKDTPKSTATSEAGVNTGALEGNPNTGTSNNGTVGTGWQVIPTYGEPGYNPTNSGGQNQGTTERQVINLSEMDSVDSLFNPRR